MRRRPDNQFLPMAIPPLKGPSFDNSLHSFGEAVSSSRLSLCAESFPFRRRRRRPASPSPTYSLAASCARLSLSPPQFVFPSPKSFLLPSSVGAFLLCWQSELGTSAVGEWRRPTLPHSVIREASSNTSRAVVRLANRPKSPLRQRRHHYCDLTIFAIGDHEASARSCDCHALSGVSLGRQ